jgi:hypothetical protein
MIHYHGGRHSTQQIAIEIWRRRHAFVSLADCGQLPISSEVAQSFALDNGAFSVWTQGVTVDWEKYYGWVEEWMRHPGFDWAVIPDSSAAALLFRWLCKRQRDTPRRFRIKTVSGRRWLRSAAVNAGLARPSHARPRLRTGQAHAMPNPSVLDN